MEGSTLLSRRCSLSFTRLMVACRSVRACGANGARQGRARRKHDTKG